MPKGIDRFVSENRRDTRRLESTYVSVSTRRRAQFDFGLSEYHIPTSVEVYTRPLNDGLYSGHPDAKHGSGRGVAGDQRGAWTLVEDTAVSEEFVRDGRNAVRDVLSGSNTQSIAKTTLGDDSTDASASDTQMLSQNGSRFAWSFQGGNSNETVARSHYRFGDYGEAISEFGVLSDSGDLYNRITTTTVNPTVNEEVRVDMTFKVGGVGKGSSVLTDDGRDALAEAIRGTSTTIGIEDFVFGDDGTSPTTGDTALGNQLFSKVAAHDLSPERITAHAVVFEVEPNTQPHTIREIGLKDNTGRLLWRVVIDAYDKDSSVEFEVYSGFRAK